MARTTTARLIATPESTPQEMQRITEKLEAHIHHIKSQHAIVRTKLAQQLARARKKNNKTNTLTIKYALIAILDAIYDSFEDTPLRDALTKDLHNLMVKLSRHYQYHGFTKCTQHAFVYYFHKVVKRSELSASGFLPWFEDYVLYWQQKQVFGERFDFNRWKEIPVTDVLRVHRRFDDYPEKKWHAHNSLFETPSREGSGDDLSPAFDNTDNNGSQFAIVDVLNNPLALMYFLMDYNVIRVSKAEYVAFRQLCTMQNEQEQLAAFNQLFPSFQERIISRPQIRVMQNRDGKKTTSALSRLMLQKLSDESVPIEQLDSEAPSSACLQDADGVKRIMLYANEKPSEEVISRTVQRHGCDVRGNDYRVSCFYASGNASPPHGHGRVQVTNLFAPFDAGSLGEPYVVQRVIQAEHHHFELLKIASMNMLEAYLVSTGVAPDRLRNAMILLDNIKALPVEAKSFQALQQMLNISKRHALRADASADASRFSFFRRHRRGSRYIELLDELRERLLYCQNIEKRKEFLKAEQEDQCELEEQFNARPDDDHAKRYLAQLRQRKQEMIQAAFGVVPDAPVLNV